MLITRFSLPFGLVLVGTAALLSFDTQAAGFQLNEHSAVGLGRAFSGEAAYGDNASGIARNPALATRFEAPQVSAGLTYISPGIDTQGEVMYAASPAAVDASQSDIANDAWVPNIYVVLPVNERWSLGLALNSNFGLSTEYGSDYSAADIADEAEIITYNVNPSVAFQLSDTLSVGVGVSVTKAEATFATSLPFGPVSGAQVIKLDGDDIAYGWNAGVAWQVSSDLRLGLGYRSQIELSLEGDARSDIIPSFNQSASLALTLPAGTELSGVYQLSPAWEVSASIVHTDWSVFEELTVNFDDGVDVLLKEEQFKDSLRYGLAIAYRMSDQLRLRAGLALDKGAVQSHYRSLSIPDTDRVWYSAGMTYQLGHGLSVDMALAYLDGDKVDLTETSSLGSQFVGTTRGDAELFAASLNYQW